jgi:hypothetical protein
MKSSQKEKGRTAIELLEEAVHLLRMSPLAALGRYYIGTLPFILALLYFWADMSRGALAADRLIPSSFTIALLFIWMKTWHAIFARFVRAQITLTPVPGLSIGKFLKNVETQSLVQVTGLILIPLSLLFSLTGWFYAFYQNYSILDKDQENIKGLIKRSWLQAKLWPGQNHVLLLIVSLLGIFVLLNVAACLYLLPQLLKTLLGVETLFTISGQWSVLNTTYLAIILGITFLCLDPLLKTAYILRCFYGESLSSGEDLKADLKRLISYKIIIPALTIFLGCTVVFHPGTVQASNKQILKSAELVSSNELNASIEKVLSRSEFTWRLPREKVTEEGPTEDNLVIRFLKWTLGLIEDAFHKIQEWVGKAYDWLKSLFPKKSPEEKADSDLDWMLSLRTLLYVLLSVLLVIMAFILWRTMKSHGKEVLPVTSEPVQPSPDLTDDRTKADELPPNRWLMLAKELMEKGDLRLALRAFYLATLAHLSDHGLLTIEGYKSNREYETELRRRAHEHQALISLFSDNVKLFDRSWYGLYKVTQEILKRFINNQERIMTFDQK